MLSWAIGFFIVAILAAIFGFTGLAGTAAGIAKVLFFLCLIAFIVYICVSFFILGPLLLVGTALP